MKLQKNITNYANLIICDGDVNSLSYTHTHTRKHTHKLTYGGFGASIKRDGSSKVSCD